MANNETQQKRNETETTRKRVLGQTKRRYHCTICWIRYLILYVYILNIISDIMYIVLEILLHKEDILYWILNIWYSLKT